MCNIASNVRRLMARQGVTAQQLVEMTGLHPRTVRGILSGKNKPHPTTLHRLAEGLSAKTDELFAPIRGLTARTFDRRTNPLVDEVAESRPELFVDWTAADFDELYSRFGTGGALTASGVAEAAQAMNRNRQVHEKVALLLESGQADVLIDLVDVLYRRMVPSGA